MKRTLCLLLAAIVLSLSACEKSVDMVDQEYEGVKYQVPASWETEEDDPRIYQVGGDATASVYLWDNENLSKDNEKAESDKWADELSEFDGISNFVKTDCTVHGKHTIKVTFDEDIDGSIYEATCYGISLHGRGFFEILIEGKKETREDYQSYCDFILDSLDFSSSVPETEPEKGTNAEATDRLVEECEDLHKEIEENEERQEERAALAEEGLYTDNTKKKTGVPDSANVIYDSLQHVHEDNCDVVYQDGTIYAMYWSDLYTKAAHEYPDSWNSVVRGGELAYKSYSSILSAYGYTDKVVVQILDDKNLDTMLLEVTEEGITYNCAD